MFEIEDIFDLLTVLCKGANLAGVKPTTCPECGRPFIPASGKNAIKYCSNYNNTYGMTCSEASRKHRIKQDKPDPNDFKARALRKAKRAKQDSTKEYFTQIALFIGRLGPIYRNSKKIEPDIDLVEEADDMRAVSSRISKGKTNRSKNNL